LDSHVTNNSNPHNVDKAQVNLANVDNTSDLNKPISTATQTALDAKEGTQTAASQAEAEAGTETAIRKWSPLRIAQAIDALAPTGGGGSSAWGGITGTLSDQTDLQVALNAKQPINSYLTQLSSGLGIFDGVVSYTAAGGFVASVFLTAGKGGTGQSSYNIGDLLYAGGTLSLSRLAGNTSTTKKILTQTGNGFASAAPVWDDIPGITIGTTTANGTAGRVLYTDGTNVQQYAVTGTGDVVRATSPTLVTPILGTPTNGTLTNCTGLPASGVVGTAAILGANTFTAIQTITQASANAGVIASTGYSLTGSNATSMIDLAGTWNTSGTPTAIKLNITDTASNSASKLLDLQVGGSSVFNVTKGGVLNLPGGGENFGNIFFTNDRAFFVGGVTGGVYWNFNPSITSSAAGLLEQKGGSGTQCYYRVFYNSESLEMGRNATNALISTTSGAIIFQTGGTSATGTERVRIASNGEVFLNLPTSAGTTGSLWSNLGIVSVA